ncbi:MAG: hypothetical protein NC350_01195 [Corallococcus sp.]|nr:hypothetical protein [Corallococcus sp.]
MIAKYGIKAEKVFGDWTYSNLSVPRTNIKNFVDELSKNNIPLNLNFYNVCRDKKLNILNFHGFPHIKSDSVEENNREASEIIFSDNPLEICKNYNLKQLVKLLQKSKTPRLLWEQMTPLFDIDMQWTIEELGGTI